MSVESAIIEIRTKTVENVLEPLIVNISSLVNRSSTTKSKGLSKSADEILQCIKSAVRELVSTGHEISSESFGMEEDFEIVIRDLQETGLEFLRAVDNFLEDPMNESLRKIVLRSSRSLLSSVTRLLILADIVDVHRLQKCLSNVKDSVHNLQGASCMQDVSSSCTSLTLNLKELLELLRPRTQDLLDTVQREDLDLAQFKLRQGCLMLMASSKAHVRHADLATIAANRTYCVRFTSEAIDQVGSACDTTYVPDAPSPLCGQAIIGLLEEILVTVKRESKKADYRSASGLLGWVDRLSAEVSALVESAVLGRDVQTLAQSCLRRLSDTITELTEAWEFQSSQELQTTVSAVSSLCSEIRHLISKAALGLSLQCSAISDCGLLLLEEAARTTNEDRLVTAVEQIQQHTTLIIDVALCLCAVSSDKNPVRFARRTVSELEHLTPQLINASKVFTLRPKSGTAAENFELFASTYKTYVEMLRTAIDDLTDVRDLLLASGDLLRNDIRRCEIEASGSKISSIMRASKDFSARCTYICDFLENDSDISNSTTIAVSSAIYAIRERLVPQFSNSAKELCRSIKANEPLNFDQLRCSGEAVLEKLTDLTLVFKSHTSTSVSRHNPSHDRDLEPESVSSSVLEADRFLASAFAFLDSHKGLFRSGISDIIRNSPIPCLKHVDDEEIFQWLPVHNTALSRRIDQFKLAKQRLLWLAAILDKGETRFMGSLIRKVVWCLEEVINYTRGEGAVQNSFELIHTAHEICQLCSAFINVCTAFGERFPFRKLHLQAGLRGIALHSHQLRTICSADSDPKRYHEFPISLVAEVISLVSAVTASASGCLLALLVASEIKDPNWNMDPQNFTFLSSGDIRLLGYHSSCLMISQQ